MIDYSPLLDDPKYNFGCYRDNDRHNTGPRHDSRDVA